MIVEYCLIPKSVVDKHVLNQNDKNKSINELSISKKEITKLPYNSPNEYRHSLEEQIKKSVSKKYIEKSLSLYYWLLENVHGLEYLKNGQLLSPIDKLNLIDFIKDIYSNKKNIPEEKINIYRLFTSIISLPAYFIDNKFIKSKLYPNYDENDNNMTSSESRKRKLQSPSPVNVSKKIKENLANDKKNEQLNSSDDDDMKYIKQQYVEHVETPKKFQRILRNRVPRKGASIKRKIVTLKKPSLTKTAWINY